MRGNNKRLSNCKGIGNLILSFHTRLIIATFKGTYLLRKPPLPELDGDIDFCSLDKKLKKVPDVMKALELLSVPTHCPVKAVI